MTDSVLFLGGTGIISHSCVRQAVAAGWKVTALCRGRSKLRSLPPEVEPIHADARGQDAAALLGRRRFDVVADFISFTPAHLAHNLDLVGGRAGQYIFISTAAAYKRSCALPITESTPLVNPRWRYARDKIACEEHLTGLIRSEDFPATVVRPAHTYDPGLAPCLFGWTDIARMRAGKPVIVQGDGTSLWVLTHAADFAKWFVGLFGDERALGEAFHITGDQLLTWNQIYLELARAAGVERPQLVHATSEAIAEALPGQGPGLLGDRTHSVMFDSSKVRRLSPGFAQEIPFSRGARQIVQFHDAHPELQELNSAFDAASDWLAQGAVINWDLAID
ncbi:MAG: NAD-dependent epimerase/dehydratase family protein [Bifidobacteriaceae bacterium]|jgi:nucleoside-diphosphate-sugar epimerase|nr:NAD-dependent epimerase/dehydratase family protein [Bifidobacteriaceae bacterium]